MWLAVGLLAGGVSSATVLWIMSGLFEPVPLAVRAALIAGVFLVALLHELGVTKVPFPQNRRQVARDIFDRNLRSAALQFGFELGTGARTYVPSTVPYVCAAFVLLGGVPFTAAVACGLGFGVGRALMPVLRAWGTSPVEWDEMFAAVSRWGAPAALVSITAGAAWLLVVPS